MRKSHKTKLIGSFFIKKKMKAKSANIEKLQLKKLEKG